jgi:hypothetical protein
MGDACNLPDCGIQILKQHPEMECFFAMVALHGTNYCLCFEIVPKT